MPQNRVSGIIMQVALNTINNIVGLGLFLFKFSIVENNVSKVYDGDL